MRLSPLLVLPVTAVTTLFIASACGDSDSRRNAVRGDAGTPDAHADAAAANNDAQGSDSSSDGAPDDTGSPDASDAGTGSDSGDSGSGGGPYLYFADNTGGRVNGFALTPSTGALVRIDMDPSTPGVQGIVTEPQPLAVVASTNGKYLFTAHKNGDIGTYAIDAATGLLAQVDANNADAGVQDFHPVGGVNALGIAADPQGRALYVADLDGNQLITLSVNNSTGALAVVQRTPIGSPRGVVVDPQAHFLFVVTDTITPAILARVALDGSGIPISADAGGAATVALANSGTCASGALSPAGRMYTACGQDQKIYGLQYTGAALVSVGSAAAGVSPIGVAVHPNGKFAYASSFSNATISTFSLDANGSPTIVGSPLGVTFQCRTLAFDGSGAHLFAGCDTKLLTFDVNASTGALTATGSVDGAGDSSYTIAIVNP